MNQVSQRTCVKMPNGKWKSDALKGRMGSALPRGALCPDSRGPGTCRVRGQRVWQEVDNSGQFLKGVMKQTLRSSGGPMVLQTWSV